MGAPTIVRSLVARYEKERTPPQFGAPGIGAQRTKYVHKLLGALAWNTTRTYDSAGQGGLVIREHALEMVAAEERKPPQYSLRVDGVRKCFVGIQPHNVRMSEDPTSALQLRRFAWSANLPASILVNFEELSVYSGRICPRPDDGPDAARVVHFDYTQYEERWDEIAGLLSKSAIEHGELDRMADRTSVPADSLPVDDAFLGEIGEWRRHLARSIDERNPGLTLEDLNSAVQSTIDRIIFLRICEDRGIEPYGQLRALQRFDNVDQRLSELFGRADARYNAGLFRPGAQARIGTVAPRPIIEDEVLRAVLRRLYYPESPYEFSVISADILGQIYECFLGQIITRSPDLGVTVELKPELRKVGGVYYTPSHVVDYVVRGTVAKLCEGKTPAEVANTRVLDPSCGSGSFLNTAYQYLLDWHRRWYVADGAERHRDSLRRVQRGGHQLTLEERTRILRNNIYGVDIDAQAVEVTKLSLLLKALEGEGQGFKRKQLMLVPSRALPNLDRNIQCGNSLVGPDFNDRAARLSHEEHKKFKPFDYSTAFPQVFAAEHPGFDAVIGNPPYLSFSGRHSVGLPDPVRAYYADTFDGFQWPAAHSLFMERSVKFLSRRYVAFIVPDQVGHLGQYGPLRKVTLAGGGLVEVRYWGENVFKNVVTPALTFILDKKFVGLTEIYEKDGTRHVGALSGDAAWNISRLQPLLDKIRIRSFSIRHILRDCGIRTNRSKEQVIPLSEATEEDIPVLEGKNIERYICHEPKRAVREVHGLRVRGDERRFTDAVFLIRQTATHPIVAPHAGHTVYFRNSLLALYAPEPWPDVLYVVGLLNSRLMRFIYRETIREAHQDAFPQVKIGSLSSLPIRELDPDRPEEKAIHAEIVRNVGELLELQRTLMQVKGNQRQRIERQSRLVDDRIDRLVDRLYGLSKEDVALIKQALGIVTSNDDGPARIPDEMTSDDLWTRLEGGPHDADWREALEELVEREDPDMATYVASQLQNHALPPDVRSALVFAAERSQCFEPDVRASLKKELLAQAIIFRDSGEQRSLWAALRRFASLVPVTEVDGLLQFLRDEDEATTKQVALQGIQNIFSVDFPEPCAAVDRVRERAHRLAVELISPLGLSRQGGASLALQAFCASAALLDPKLLVLAERLLLLERVYLVMRAVESLRSLKATWGSGNHSGRRVDAFRLVSDALAALGSEEGSS
jgi:methylase of polypeptide subunit release factors